MGGCGREAQPHDRAAFVFAGAPWRVGWGRVAAPAMTASGVRTGPRPLLALLVAAAVAAGGEDPAFLGRHAAFVRGDFALAIPLYRKALEETGRTEGEQALLHLRIALCHDALGQDLAALDHLAEPIFARRGVSPHVARRAADLRERIRARQPRPVERAGPAAEEAAAARARRLAGHLEQAKRHLAERNDVHAFRHIQAALEIDPDNAEARALEAQWETLLSGMTQLLRDPLRFLRSWSEAQIRAVARQAQVRLKEALVHAKAGEHNLAESRFREAVATIDACEFAGESEELLTLRQSILGHRAEVHQRGAASGRPLPPLPEQPRRTTVAGDLLNHLQRMLDMISEPGQEYRILPVPARRGEGVVRSPLGKPRRFLLLRDEPPSRFSAASFARSYLPLRVEPASWNAKGNYLDTAGEMLVARNRPEVLDALQAELRRMEALPREAMRCRFLFVSVPAAAIASFERRYGAFRRSERGGAPVLHAAIPSAHAFEEICGMLRDEGGDVGLPEGLFDVEIENGVPQTLFAALPLARAPAYASVALEPSSALTSHYGMVLDLFPLRDALGRTALLLNVASRMPLPPALGSDGRATPRFLSQEAETFVDLAPGATLVVAGLADPFAEPPDPQRILLMLLGTGGREAPSPAAGPNAQAEVPLHDLLLRVRDNPGPKVDPRQGFVRRDPVEVLEARASFLREALSDQLGTPEVEVDVDAAVARVPLPLRERAAAAVNELRAQGRTSFVVRIQASALRTQVFERLMAREKLELRAFGQAFVAMLEGSAAELLPRDLRQREPADVFAPGREAAALTALGLQAQHSLSARTHTSPAYGTDEDLARSATRTITEGLRVSVRPWIRGTSLLAWVEVETCGLDSEVEELALAQAVPSYRTELSGTLARGLVDFGNPLAPSTALVCRIPHPTASSTETLTEINVAIAIRPAP